MLKSDHVCRARLSRSVEGVSLLQLVTVDLLSPKKHHFFAAAQVSQGLTWAQDLLDRRPCCRELTAVHGALHS